MKINILTLLFLGCLFMYGCDSTPNRENTTEVAEDQNEEMMETDAMEDASEFLVEAASSGMMEVELGKLALQKAKLPAVKDFAQKMIDDHSKANQDLKTLASSKNITLPAAMGDEEQRKVNNLKDEDREDYNFDKEYMDLMVSDHKDDVDAFQEAVDDIKDADVKAFASKVLPTLKSHLEEAKTTNDMVENTADNM